MLNTMLAMGTDPRRRKGECMYQSDRNNVHLGTVVAIQSSLDSYDQGGKSVRMHPSRCR